MDAYSGEKFLDELYKKDFKEKIYVEKKYDDDLKKYVRVKKEYKDKKGQYEDVRKYLLKLVEVHSKANTETKKNLLKSFYYEEHIAKNEKALKEKIKQEHGILSEEKLQEIINPVIKAQKMTLDKWLDYLSSDTAYYPAWAKYWAFQGMLKMGTYDEGTSSYQKRTEYTEAPYVDANPEILAKAMETIEKSVNKEKIDDEELERLIKTGSFSKIYALLEKKYKKNVIEYSGTEGIWKKYDQGSKEEALRLNKDLQDKNTHWCTAASESMAISQICGPYGKAPEGGDFYVYYTKDKEGNYTLPRIAIRMNGHDEIGEIRGILDGQNMEEEMTPILEEKLNEMTFLTVESKKDAFEKLEGLREITRIYQKTTKKEDLTEEELEHLYTKQYGFGWDQDPKVEKTIKKRNSLDDFNKTNNKDLKVKFLTRNILPKGTQINDKELILETVKRSGVAIRYASENLKSDREIVLEAVKQNGCAIRYASENLKSDKEIVLEAVKKYGDAFEYASDELKNDKKIVLEAVKQNTLSIKYASEELKNDKDVMLEAVKQEGRAIKCASENLKSDREIVLEAVKQNGLALEYASENLKKDKEIVLEAVKQYGMAIKYASDELKNDKEIVLEAVRENGKAIRYASDELKNDREIVLEAVKQNGYVLMYVSKELINDKKIVLEAVRKYGDALEYASDELKNDKEIVLEAVRENVDALEFASEELKNDPDILLEIEKKKAKEDNNNGPRLGFIDILSLTTLVMTLGIVILIIIKIFNK